MQGLHKSISTHINAWFRFRKNTLYSHIYCTSNIEFCSFIHGIFLIRKEGLLCALVDIPQGLLVSWTLSIIWYSKKNMTLQSLNYFTESNTKTLYQSLNLRETSCSKMLYSLWNTVHWTKYNNQGLLSLTHNFRALQNLFQEVTAINHLLCMEFSC